ncbi:MAG TPA: EF-hand domain-containing protein [Casimicrobiaceae bacterium]|jgi:hypothetical protein
MNDQFSSAKPLIAALSVSAVLGFAGQAPAQSTSGNQSGAQTKTRPPAAATDTGSSTAPSSGSYGATTGGPSEQSMNPSGMGSMSSPNVIPPSTSETSDSAFKKLDASNKGYVTRDDAKSVSGFDRTFQTADVDHDGKLSSDEFKKAWSSFTGNSP